MRSSKLQRSLRIYFIDEFSSLFLNRKKYVGLLKQSYEFGFIGPNTKQINAGKERRQQVLFFSWLKVDDRIGFERNVDLDI